ncbi:MAG: hypothetical protein HY556_01645 [Euryarchaeota archaeon]|nr:hypothetical protein [Euryarchaeota archaeon]
MIKVAWSTLSALVVLVSGCVSTTPPTSGDASTIEPAAVQDMSPSNATQASKDIARGHIVAAGPYTNVRSIAVLAREGVDGFFFPAPPAKTMLTTRTMDNRGLGYDLSMNFHDAARVYLGGCSTPAMDETCVVPVGAATGEVTAAMGVDLDVVVLIAQ